MPKKLGIGMQKSEYTELRVEYPQHPTPQQKQFAWNVKAAAKLAMQHFDRHALQELVTPTADSERSHQLRNLLRRAYDWRSDTFSVKGTVDELILDQKLYLEVADHLHDADALFATLNALAQNQIEELVLTHNNLPKAALRYDLFTRYTDTIVAHLKSEGLLDAEDRRFDDLLNGYQCALKGYMELRTRIGDRTGGHYHSLMEWAADSVAEKDNTKGEDIDENRVVRLMFRRYRTILREQGMGTASHGLIPTPYIYFATLVEHAAMREARYAHPFETDRQVLGAHAKPFLEKHLYSLMELPVNLDNVAEWSVADRHVQQCYADAHRQPVDFSAALKQGCEEATKLTLAAFPRLYRESEKHRQHTHSKGEARLLTEIGGLPYHAEGVERLCRIWIEQMEPKLATAHNVQDLVEMFEQDADAALHETTCGLEHPAMIRLRGYYAEAVGRAMAAEWKARNAALPEGAQAYDVRGLTDQFDAIAHKYALCYEAHWKAAAWCSQATDGAHGDFGQYALSMQLAYMAKDFGEWTSEQRQAVATVARNYMIRYGEEKGVPQAWASHPMIPLLYDRAEQYVRGEYRREMHKAAPHLTPLLREDRRPGEALNAAEVTAATSTREAEKEYVDQSLPATLYRAVEMFAPAPPNGYGLRANPAKVPHEASPYLDAVSLRDMEQFFEAAHSAGRHH